MKPAIRFCTLLFFVLLFACAPPENTVVGVEGGCINGPDGITLCLPKGALSGDMKLEIIKFASEEKKAFTSKSGVYLLQPPGVRFLKKATLTIPYNSKDISVRLFMKGVLDSEWKSQTVSLKEGNIIAEVQSLYLFALGSPIDSGGCKDADTRECGDSSTGECKKGKQTCKDGQWGDCKGEVKAVSEVCGDNKDNDCDGDVDEDCSGCKDGDARECGDSDTGECKKGKQYCSNNQWGECKGEVKPSKELCDGKDNDCDGSVDEDLKQACNNGCGTGQEVCKAGQWQDCDAPKPTTEVCDGKDNDCDGTTDEDCKCKDGDKKPCGTDTGECSEGKQTCTAGKWGECIGEVKPSKEVCDGKDNDCNGSIDENLQQACSTACGKGTEVCKAGKWVNCSAVQPTKEVCDGKDNDCNGKIDESCPCIHGNKRACGSSKGECKQGTQTCNSGVWSACTGEVKPVAETCDGKDNNCDGKIDENCQCQYGDTQKCGSAKGECKQGIQTCLNGKWGGCIGETKPTVETCDGKDNDCDGQTDESLTKSCSSTCGKGQQTCSAGQWGACSTPKPTTEVCDGKDNDCDGSIDEALSKPCKNNCGSGVQVCRSGTWQACNAPKPTTEVCDGKDNDCDGQTDESLSKSCSTACGKGTQTCSAGKWTVCNAPKPSAEVCDGKDNDCDGKTDEGCQCTTGQTRICGGTNVGACKTGIQTCASGQWGACIGYVDPTTEVCDGKDNDCDGQTDESLSKSCSTACGKGTQTCSAGKWTVCNAPKPVAEVCGDNKDNDCDGQTDEGCSTTCKDGDTRKCGKDTGACVAGTQTCISGIWGACLGEVKPVAETCDGKDNDCDGQTDESLAKNCSTACGKGTQTCSSGTWSACSAGQPVTEVCGDKKDNDCDGLVDEGCSTATGCSDPGTPTTVWSSENQYHVVTAADFSRDGKWLAYIEQPTTSTLNNKIQVYLVDLNTMKRTLLATTHGTYGRIGVSTSINFSPKSKYLTYFIEDKLTLFDFVNKKSIASYRTYGSTLAGFTSYYNPTFGPQETKFFIQSSWRPGTSMTFTYHTFVVDLQTQNGVRLTKQIVSFGSSDATVIEKLNAANNGVGQLNVLDSSTFAVNKVLGGHTKNILMTVRAENHRFLLSIGNDKMLKIWDLQKGQLQHSISGVFGSSPDAYRFSPDATKVMLLQKYDWMVVDVLKKTMKKLDTVTNSYRMPVFSPSGRYVITYEGYKEIRVFDLSTMSKVRTFPFTSEPIAFSANEDKLLIGDKQKSRVSLINLKDGVAFKVIPSKNGYFAQAAGRKKFFLDYKLYECCSSPKAVSDVCDGLDNDCDGVVDSHCSCKQIQLKKSITSQSSSYALSGVANLVAVYNSKKSATDITFHSLSTGAIVRTLKGKSKSTTAPMDFSSNGKYFAESSGSTLRIWSVATGQIQHDFADKHAFKMIRFVPNTTLIAALIEDPKDTAALQTPHIIKLYDYNTKKFVREWKPGFYVWKLNASPDGKGVYAGGPPTVTNGTSIGDWAGWFVSNGQQIEKGTLPGQFHDIRFGGKPAKRVVSFFMLAASSRPVVYQYKPLSGGSPEKSWNSNTTNPMTYHPKEDILLARFGDRLHIWTPGMNSMRYSTKAYTENFLDIKISQDGTTIVGKHTNSLSVWQCVK